jgi:septum formation protein
MTRLVLASTSARRLDLLARIGVVPDRVAAPDIDETPAKHELPRLYALRMASEKAAAVPHSDSEAILAGDTTIALGRRIVPPAETETVQRSLLGLLSGRRHRCYSAVALIDGSGALRTRLSTSIVAFKALSAADIDAYVASGEGLGKAGGYAIQGRAEAFVRFLSGSHSGVVGLPLFETRALLLSAGVPLG